MFPNSQSLGVKLVFGCCFITQVLAIYFTITPPAVPNITWTIARSLGPEDIQLAWEIHGNEEDVKDIEIWVSCKT